MGYLIISAFFYVLLFLIRHYAFVQLPIVYDVMLSLAFIILVGLFAGKFFKSIGFPEITGYLITGMCISPYLLGLVSINALKEMKFIEEIAITFIALQSGMEMRMSFLKKQWKEITLLTLSIGIAVFIGLFFTAIILFKNMTTYYLTFALLIGILLVLKSPLSTIAVIKDSRTHTLFGGKILSIAILKDIVVTLIFVLIVAYGRGNLSIGGVISHIVLSMLFGVVVGIIIAIYMHRVTVERHIFILIVGFLVSQIYFINLDPLLASIIIGFFIQNFTNFGEDIEAVLDQISPIIYLLFFVLADASIDFRIVISLLPVTLIFIAVKWVFSEIGIVLVTKDSILRKYGTFGLLNQSGLSIALVIIVGNVFPQIGVKIKGIVLSVVVITDLFAPFLFKKALHLAEKEESAERL